jgi:predicted transcriptional regulator
MSKLVSTITFSKKRENLLLFLIDGPKTLEDIRNSLNVTSSGMIPQIRKLEEQNLVQREGKKYLLTDTGMIIAEMFNSFVKTIDIIEKYKDFWAFHDINAIPFHLLKRLYELGNCRLVESKISEIYEPHKEFMKYITGSKKFMGIAPIFHQLYPQLFVQLAESGADVSIILTKDIYEKTVKGHADMIEKFISFENAQLFVSNYDIRLACAVTDSFLSISFFFKNSSYDSQSELVSSETTAIKWGEELCDYFIKKSNRIKSV